MFEAFAEGINNIMGLSLEPRDLHWYHMVVRASVVYAGVLAFIRLGHKRFLGKGTAFDVILGILFGSVASRAINGSAPFVPTMAACAALVLVHALFARLAFRSRRFSRLIEGDAKLLIRDGELDRKSMRETDVTDEDLLEALRNHGKKDAAQIDLAHLERDGKVSVVPKTAEPKIVDISVRSGVQTVRIQMQ
jgi:uncharacterized membrane protein YcaP (DUF421 family)